MKSLAGIIVTAAILLGGYYFYLKSLPTAAEGTAATQAISLTGVSTDLIQIAQAERNFEGVNGRCASLEEMTSSGLLTMNATQRDGYSYSVECSGNEFKAIAQHAPAPSTSPIRYPILMVDQDMHVSEVK